MNMYTHLLSSALDNWVDELTGAALIDYALDSRREMLNPRGYQRGTSLTALSAQLSYDRALLKLCEQRGIAVIVINFVHPQQERNRLELALAAVGLDLASLAAEQVD